jgi:hypothetical protein
LNAAAAEAAEGEERAPGSAEGEPSKKLAAEECGMYILIETLYRQN